MKHFYLITNYEKDRELRTTNRLVSYIQKNGGTCDYQTILVNEREKVKLGQIPEHTQCIFVLGGDGTLIKAARELISTELPLIGINFGNLGYLAEIEQEDIESTIDMLLQDRYQVEQRMMLQAELMRSEKCIYTGTALNDVVVSKGGNGKVLEFKVYVNGQFINKYSADGMIISTPTGSTAYNLSAGGPIAEPCAEIIILTPVCPHTLITRSVVLSADSVIEIEICSDTECDRQGSYVYCDGNDEVQLRATDIVRIQKSEKYAKIAKLSKLSFFETLQKKMSNR